VLASYARLADVRVPEDVALVGADNDRLECEFVVPSLSSVAIPWCNVGEQVARLLARGLAGQGIAASRVLVSPLHVIARRSSDTLAIADSLVADAVRWIKDHGHERVTVPTVAAAVHSTRQRLERRFRAALGRTVAHEIRRSRVETAKGLLSSTPLALSQVARQCGFSTTALLSETFRRELGVSPGRFRRDMRRLGQEAAQGVEPTARAW
jgi:LacI family transcriptional regulator